MAASNSLFDRTPLFRPEVKQRPSRNRSGEFASKYLAMVDNAQHEAELWKIKYDELVSQMRGTSMRMRQKDEEIQKMKAEIHRLDTENNLLRYER